MAPTDGTGDEQAPPRPGLSELWDASTPQTRSIASSVVRACRLPARRTCPDRSSRGILIALLAVAGVVAGLLLAGGDDNTPSAIRRRPAARNHPRRTGDADVCSVDRCSPGHRWRRYGPARRHRPSPRRDHPGSTGNDPSRTTPGTHRATAYQPVDRAHCDDADDTKRFRLAGRAIRLHRHRGLDPREPGRGGGTGAGRAGHCSRSAPGGRTRVVAVLEPPPGVLRRLHRRVLVARPGEERASHGPRRWLLGRVYPSRRRRNGRACRLAAKGQCQTQLCNTGESRLNSELTAGYLTRP